METRLPRKFLTNSEYLIRKATETAALLCYYLPEFLMEQHCNSAQISLYRYITS